MLKVLRLCVALGTIHWTCRAQEYYSGVASVFIGSRTAESSQISELGRDAEEKINCFGAFDVELSEKWAKMLGLPAVEPKTSSSVESPKPLEGRTPSRNLLKVIEQCARNLTESSKINATRSCMRNLIATEVENDAYVSAPELFDDTLQLPFLTFLDIRQVRELLFQNRSGARLSSDEKRVLERAMSLASSKETIRDKVFVIDQMCEWKTLKEFSETKTSEELFQSFKRQVIHVASRRLAHESLKRRDLRPGRWLPVYNQWVPVRLENIREMNLIVEDLKEKMFTTRELCRYATTLGNHYAEQELKAVRPEVSLRFNLAIQGLATTSREKASRVCQTGSTEECERIRSLVASYSEDLTCLKSFADLLTNHFLHSINLQYTDELRPITYPESFCRSTTKYKGLVLRYCKCIGSFCASQDLGELNADDYELVTGSKVVRRT